MTYSSNRFRHAILAAQRSGHRVLGNLLKPHGLTPAWAEVLTVLNNQGALTIRELSRYLICEADHPSRLVSRMEAKGYLKRETNPNDGRAFLISLTESGKSAMTIVEGAEARLDHWITGQLTTAALDQISDVFEQMLRNTNEGKALIRRFTSDTNPHV